MSSTPLRPRTIGTGKPSRLADRTARVQLVTATALTLTMLGCLAIKWGSPTWWALPLLAVAVASTELAVVHVAFRRQRWTFSLTEGVIGAAFVFASGSWAVLAVAAGVLVAQRIRRQPTLKLLFNVALFAASTLAGTATAQALGSNVAAATAGLAVFWLINTGLVALPMAIMTGHRLRAVFWDSVSVSTLQEAGTSSIGLLAAWLALNAPMGLLGLVVPVILLWISYEEQSARSAEARLFAELARGQESAGARSIDISAEVVLTAAARLFGGADVEMVRLGLEGPVCYSGNESGVTRRATDPTAFSAPWVLATLAAGVRTGVENGQPYCSAMLGERDQPLAVFCARRPVGGATFGRREVALARLLVGQGESWLAAAWLSVQRDAAVGHAAAVGKAAKALGDIGAHTAPALGLLQESAGRLVRLAGALDAAADVQEIVGELHVVERAVASLLGAVALSADPELATAGDAFDEAPGPSRPEWTTTGVLPTRSAPIAVGSTPLAHQT
jgi:hypothetical protein